MVRMFPASPAETRRSISPWVTLHRLTSESRIRPSPEENTRFAATPWWKASIACVVPSGRRYTENQHRQNGGEQDGTVGREGRGYHRRDKRHRASHRGDFRCR